MKAATSILVNLKCWKSPYFPWHCKGLSWPWQKSHSYYENISFAPLFSTLSLFRFSPLSMERQGLGRTTTLKPESGQSIICLDRHSNHQQGRVNTVNPSLHTYMNFLIHPCKLINYEKNVCNPPKLGKYWDFPQPLRFPSDFTLRKYLGRRGWISQYLPRFGGARIQS